MAEHNPYQREPIRPNRVRKIGAQSVTFLPHRFLRAGFFATLSHQELLLYFFLALAADRYGVSFYHYDRICGLLMLDIDDYLRARNGLIAKDLLAFDGTRFQLLSLPERPVLSTPRELAADDNLEDDPATIRRAIQRSFETARR